MEQRDMHVQSRLSASTSRNLAWEPRPMNGSIRTFLLRYGSAVGSLVLAALLCLLLDPIIDGHSYYLWFLLALVFIAWYGGLRPCFLAFVLSLPLIGYTFPPPRFQFVIEGTAHQVGFAAYCFVGAGITFYSTGLAEGVRKVFEANKLLAENLPARLTEMEQQLAAHITNGHETERRIAASYKVTSILARSENLDDAASPVLQTICESLGWDMGLFWAVDEHHKVLRCIRGWHRPDIDVAAFVEHSRQTQYPKGTGLPGRVWEKDMLIAVPDMVDANLARSDLAARMELHGAVGFPVRNGSEFLGVMEFFGRHVRAPDDAVVQMMGCIGGQISQFIERRHAERVLEQQQHDRHTATTIQQALLPKAMPKLAGFEIGGKAVFAQDVGGDCFDFVPMAVECEDCLGVLVADASGHGMASALLVGETRAYLRALALTCSDVGQMLTLTNNRLACGTTDYFVTLLLARFDPRTRSFTYANAGHCPGYILDSQGQTRMVLKSSAIPLGIDKAGQFSACSAVALQPGELVVLHSDGLIEARSAEDQPLGAERMLDIIRVHRNESLDTILDVLFRAVGDFAQRSIPQDDMTAVLIRVQADA